LTQLQYLGRRVSLKNIVSTRQEELLYPDIGNSSFVHKTGGSQ
jgi:hypothetical protein